MGDHMHAIRPGNERRLNLPKWLHEELRLKKSGIGAPMPLSTLITLRSDLI